MVPDEFWKAGFGQTLSWQGRRISYKMRSDQIKGEYSGQKSQPLSVRLAKTAEKEMIHVTMNGHSAKFNEKEGWINILLPAASLDKPCGFEIKLQ
jgi:hypothetical protein